MGPVYAIGRDRALVAGNGGEPVFSGFLEELCWVTVRRDGDHDMIRPLALYDDDGRYLLRRTQLPSAILNQPENYWIKPVMERKLLASDSLIINPNLAYNPAIASIVNQVDSAQLRSWV